MENGFHSPGGAGADQYTDRLNDFATMVEGLIRENSKLKAENEKLIDDVTNEADSRLRFQRMVKAKDQELNEARRAAVSYPFRTFHEETKMDGHGHENGHEKGAHGTGGRRCDQRDGNRDTETSAGTSTRILPGWRPLDGTITFTNTR